MVLRGCDFVSISDQYDLVKVSSLFIAIVQNLPNPILTIKALSSPVNTLIAKPLQKQHKQLEMSPVLISKTHPYIKLATPSLKASRIPILYGGCLHMGFRVQGVKREKPQNLTSNLVLRSISDPVGGERRDGSRGQGLESNVNSSPFV